MRTAIPGKFFAIALLLASPQAVAAFQGGSSEEPETPAAPSGQDGEAAADNAPAARTNSAPVPDADLRTFGGGTCLNPPLGSDRNIGGLLGVLLPQVIGAGVDALTAALQAAGDARVLARSTVLALEYTVKCVQIARGVAAPSAELLNDPRGQAASRALAAAPFLLEFYFRQSRDGTALLVAPTRLIYRQTLDRRQTRRPRELYATFTFTDRSGANPSAVTVPLGSFRTRAEPYEFDPMMRPLHPEQISPLGAANSVWIPNPFKATGEARASAQAPAQGGDGQVRRPPPSSRTRARNGSRQPAATAPAPTPAPAPIALASLPGTPIFPLNVTVVISETRPGSAFARVLAGILQRSRAGIVTQLDPIQRAEARRTAATAAATAATTATSAYVTAYSEYATTYQDYCGADDDAGRAAKAPDLYEAQMKLLQASNAVQQPVPFTDVVDPTGRQPYPGFCL